MEEHGVHTVHYVTQDAMPNFKLRVTLTRLSAARPGTVASAHTSSSDQADAASASTAADAAAPAAAAAAAAPTSTAGSGRPEPFKVVRTFTWQEKVYSKAELLAAQVQVRANQQHGISTTSPRRAAHFGSQSHIGTDRLAAPPEGSVLFSYVQTDDWCERFETSRSVTTSKWEHRNHLARKLATDARNRQKMLNFQCMVIMADLGDETTVAGCNEKVLCVIRAHHDGTFDMTPGFSGGTGQQRYRFEDDHGGIFEYALELASHASTPSLEKRAAKLASAVSAQAEELRRQHNPDKLPVPGPDASALRLLLLAELVSAAGFERDRLYVEWQLHFDPDLWVLQHSEQEVAQPGLIQGVTHVSQMVQYPADPSTDTPAVWVAHFAHPIEVEWVARAAPAPRHWPRLFLQVCTYDLWDRATTEGYGWLQLGPCSSSGSATQYMDTWKPLGSRRDQQRAFFVGGSEELQDMASCAVPKGHASRVLNKYGYQTQTSGNVKVRTHMVLQAGAAGGASPRKSAAAKGVAAVAAAAHQRRSLSLAVVLERARSRLQEARGGEVVVREGLLVQAPVITAHPADLTVSEGSTVQFSVKAVGLGPLRYQWYRDSKRLTVATSTSPLLVLVDVGAAEGGSYHCQVTNKDGSAASSKALLTVHRVGRLQAAAGGGGGAVSSSGAADAARLEAGAAAGSSSSSGGAAAERLPGSSARRALATVPRTLPLGGDDRTGLPLSTRLGSSSGSPARGSPGRPAGSLSPLIGSRPQSAAGRFPPAAEAHQGDAAGDAAGASAAGGSRLSGISVPTRRFAASRPSTSAAAASPPAQQVGPRPSTSGPQSESASCGTEGEGLPAQAQQQQQQQHQQQLAQQSAGQPLVPPSVDDLAARDGGEAATSQAAAAPGSAAVSPVRRTRVSEL